ncbi:hypothetical protein HID58_052239 [Brassica napus]|uniref:Uncharacterized protein n=1 Tax=Brassica napus TaxID=3708 RepID=A0ABQ8ACQ4_BRANA|nr:hypothetical protein HID58_052239 [Brassica napus]
MASLSSHPLMKKLVTFILSTMFLTTASSETQCQHFKHILPPSHGPFLKRSPHHRLHWYLSPLFQSLRATSIRTRSLKP